MDEYMSKPFSEQQLRTLLTRWAARENDTVTAGSSQSVVAAETPVLGAAAVPVTPEAVEGALDMEQLRRMQKTHPTLMVRLVETYLGYGPKAIHQLLLALEAENITQLKTTAHSLKSSSANIGAMKLSGLCKELEARMKTAATWETDANITAVAEIESEFQAVAVALGEFRAELKAAQPVAPVAKPISA